MRRAVTISLVVACSGCTDLLKSSRINPQTIAIYPGGENPEKPQKACAFTQGISDSNNGAINIDCFRFPEDFKAEPPTKDFKAEPPTKDFKPEPLTKDRLPAYDLAAGRVMSIGKNGELDTEPRRLATTPAEWEGVRFYRNRLAAILVKQADDICTVEKGRLVRSETGVNFLLSFLTTSLSSAAAIVTGERAKSILAGLATGSSATQTNFNSTFYKNQLTQAISKSMDTERARLLALLNGKQGEKAQTFTVDDMIREVNRYHQACSFEHGLQLLLDKAVDASGAEAALQTRTNRAAIVELDAQIASLYKEFDELDKKQDSEQLKAQIAELRSKRQSLILATVELQTTRPNAAQNVDTTPPVQPSSPDDGDLPPQGGKSKTKP